jgi:hypothetical protein
LVEQFERCLRINNYSIGRIEKYWSFLRTLHKLLGKCFENISRKDVEDLLIKIDSNNEWSEWTKHDFKRIFKFYYR